MADQSTAQQIPDNPDFRDMKREELDAVAPKYEIDPSEYSKVEDLRAALVKAHEDQSGPDDKDAEIEALRAELEALRAGSSESGEKRDHDPVDPGVSAKIREATKEAPWITADMTAGA